jgi:hypothetical protein
MVSTRTTNGQPVEPLRVGLDRGKVRVGREGLEPLALQPDIEQRDENQRQVDEDLAGAAAK